MKQPSSILLHYIMIFFLFAGVIFLLFIPVFQYISNSTLNKELSNIQGRLDRGIDAFDSALIAISTAITATKNDPRFVRFKYDFEIMSNEYILLNQMQIFYNNLFVPLPLVADAGIILSNDIILSRYRFLLKPDLYTFYPFFINQGQNNWEEWKTVLINNSPISPSMDYFSQDYGTYKAITYTVPWYKEETEKILFYATLPIKNILSLLANETTLADGFVRIYDSDGKELMMYSSSVNNEKKVSAMKNSYYIVTNKSQIEPLYFEVGISKTAIRLATAPVSRGILLFAFLVLLFIISVSLFFAKKGSEPMQRLMVNIDSDKYITKFKTRLDQSIYTVREQSRMLRSTVFKNALYLGLYETDDLRNFRFMYPDFPHAFQIALINYEFPGNLTLEDESIFQIELKNAVVDFLGISIMLLDMTEAVLLFLPLSDNEQNWDQRVIDLQNDLNRKIKADLVFSLSDVFNKEEDLFQAWQQVNFIQKTSGINGELRVGKMDNIAEKSHAAPLIISMLQMIYDSIKTGNEKVPCAILEKTLSRISLVEHPILSEIIYKMLSSLILLIKTENPSSFGKTNIPVFQKENIDELFSKQFPDCFRKISEILLINNEKNITKLGKVIIEYINDHYSDPLFYIPSLLDQFNISRPTLQKIVKSMTGETISVYIEKIRLKKAWELLSENNLSVTETAKLTGFSNINSFHKTFKRVYGFPPGKINKN